MSHIVTIKTEVRDPLAVAAAFRSCLAAGLFHQDIAHGPCRGKKEVSPAFQLQVGLAQQAQIGLVDEGRRL